MAINEKYRVFPFVEQGSRVLAMLCLFLAGMYANSIYSQWQLSSMLALMSENGPSSTEIVTAIRTGNYTNEELSIINQESYAQLTVDAHQAGSIMDSLEITEADEQDLVAEFREFRAGIKQARERLQSEQTDPVCTDDMTIPVCIPEAAEMAVGPDCDTLCEEMAKRAAFKEMMGDILHENPSLFRDTELRPNNVQLKYSEKAGVFLLTIGKHVDDGRGPLHFYKKGLQNANIDYELYGDLFADLSPDGAYVRMFCLKNVTVSAQVAKTGNDALFQPGTWHIPIATFNSGSEEAQKYIKIIQDYIALGTTQQAV